jgi:hypothetical protein
MRDLEDIIHEIREKIGSLSMQKRVYETHIGILNDQIKTWEEILEMAERSTNVAAK